MGSRYAILAGWTVPGRLPDPARNFRLGVLNGVFANLAETLIDPTLVLVAFVSRLSDSPILIGLVAPLRDGGWYLPQFWLSGYAQSLPRRITLYRRAAVARIAAWGAMAAAVFLIRDPGWLLIAFFAGFGIYALSSGWAGLAFMEVVGKTIPPGRLTVFFAWRLFLGGLAALGAAAVVRELLREPGGLVFPANFGVLFALGWAAVTLSLTAFASVHEPADAVTPPRASFGRQLRRAGTLVRGDPLYRRFLALRVSLMLAGAATPYFAVYVQTVLGGPLEAVGTYLAVYTAASLLANAAFGRLAGRLGNRRILTVAAGAGLLMTVVIALLVFSAWLRPISGGLAALWLLPAYALSGVREAGLGVAGQSLLLEIAPTEARSLYLGFTNSLLGVVLLGTGLSGVFVAALGFPALLGVALLANAVAVWLALRLRRQPPGARP